MHVTFDFPSLAADSHAWLLKGWRTVGTWQASSGSAPFTPVIGGDPLGTLGSDPYDVPDSISGSGCSSAVNAGNPGNYLSLQCFAFPNPATRLGNMRRNSIIGLSNTSLDISLTKDTHVERISTAFVYGAGLKHSTC